MQEVYKSIRSEFNSAQSEIREKDSRLLDADLDVISAVPECDADTDPLSYYILYRSAIDSFRHAASLSDLPLVSAFLSRVSIIEPALAEVLRGEKKSAAEFAAEFRSTFVANRVALIPLYMEILRAAGATFDSESIRCDIISEGTSYADYSGSVDILRMGYVPVGLSVDKKPPASASIINRCRDITPIEHNTFYLRDLEMLHASGYETNKSEGVCEKQIHRTETIVPLTASCSVKKGADTTGESKDSHKKVYETLDGKSWRMLKTEMTEDPLLSLKTIGGYCETLNAEIFKCMSPAKITIDQLDELSERSEDIDSLKLRNEVKAELLRVFTKITEDQPADTWKRAVGDYKNYRSVMRRVLELSSERMDKMEIYLSAIVDIDEYQRKMTRDISAAFHYHISKAIGSTTPKVFLTAFEQALDDKLPHYFAGNTGIYASITTKKKMLDAIPRNDA